MIDAESMTDSEIEAAMKVLAREQLKRISEHDEYHDPEYDDECRVNAMVAERLAEEDRRNDERAAEDELYAAELRQIRYLESRYDDDYGW